MVKPSVPVEYIISTTTTKKNMKSNAVFVVMRYINENVRALCVFYECNWALRNISSSRIEQPRFIAISQTCGGDERSELGMMII